MNALVLDLWRRRHELTPAEWLDAAPILLGMLVAQVDRSPEGEKQQARSLEIPQHSSDMVERVADCFLQSGELDGEMTNPRTVALLLARTALEACHHAELVGALFEAERCLTMILVDYGVDRYRPRAEAATNVFRVLLTKIGDRT